MALFRWRGDGAGTKSDWNDGRNWVDGAGAAYAQARYPGSVAGTADDALFDLAPTGGALDCAGYAGGALEKLASLRVGSLYDGDIGSAGTYLQVPVSLVTVDGTAAGTLYLDACPFDQLTWTDGAGYLKGTVVRAAFVKGTVTAECDWGIFEPMVVGYATSSSADMTLTIPSTGVRPWCGIHQNGGTLALGVESDLIISGGTCTLNAGADRLWMAGGAVVWAASDIQELHAQGGSLSCTVTNPATLVWGRMSTGAIVNLDNGLGNITVTDLIYYGGSYVPPLGV